MSDTVEEAQGERRAQVRRELQAGDVTGLRLLATRLEAHGFSVEPDDLRGDIRALGAVRVERVDGSVLAIPVDAPTTPATGSKLATELVSDPDWKLQVGVVAVVAAFLLVAFLGWLISG